MNGYGIVKAHLTNSPHKRKEGREFLSLYLLPHSKAFLGGYDLKFFKYVLCRAEGSGRIGVLRLALDVAAVIVGIRPRLSRRLIVLAHELVEAVVGVGRRALAVGDGRDVPARVVGIGIRRRAGFPRRDLPRGRRGRGIVVADRGLDHGLPAALRVHRGHPPQRVVGIARGDGSLRRFRQAVVLIVGIARGVGRAVERLLPF